MNLLFHADAATACARLPENLRFDLVYLDPPYAVGTTMTARGRKGQTRGRKQKASGPDAFHDGASVTALIDGLATELEAIRTRMRKGSALYLHMDWRAVHEAKIAADRIFGRGAFCGEICWAPGNGSRGARGFAITHQTILVYTVGGRRALLFHTDHPLLREPYAETSLGMHFTKEDEDGRRYRERTVGKKTYRYYADRGRRIGSVWTDIPAMVANTPLMKEGTGYPTQKPERLMERIIRASSEEGDVVADLMCGSGTTLAVAARLGRRFVGADMGALAIETTRHRLERDGIDFRFEPEGSA